VQQERLDVWAEFGDEERRPVCHEAADEMNVAAQPELGEINRGLPAAAGFGQCGGELRTPV